MLGHSLIRLLVRSHRTLVCLLVTACLLIRSLAYFAHSRARGTVNDWMAIYSVFSFYSGPQCPVGALWPPCGCRHHGRWAIWTPKVVKGCFSRSKGWLNSAASNVAVGGQSPFQMDSARVKEALIDVVNCSDSISGQCLFLSLFTPLPP